nr:calnexin [Parasteatoda tepidariorum]XP_042909471.1 calnexin [Parasteatoda tepidariorum]
MLLKFSPLILLIAVIVAEGDLHDVDDMPDIGEEVIDAVETEKEPEVEIEEIPYVTPHPIGNAYIAEHFDHREDYDKKWIQSEAKKDGVEAGIAKYDGKWSVEEAEKNGLNGDFGLVLKSKARHHAISSRLEKPFLFDNKPFILQYEVRFQNGQECGGAYLKLLSQDPNMDLRKFHDKTPYTLMFGPDKCGNDHKLHFIFRHRNPKNGSFEEKHWKRTANVPKLDDVFKDKKPHLFTLIINPDSKFEVLVDKQSIQKGSLLEDFNPPVNPEAEIDDPNDSKPSDWDEREKISDPTATKPDDWDEEAPRQIVDPDAKKPDGWLDDEPELLPDPKAEKPMDWDDEMDGEWEAPLITNPKCEKVGCGKWKAPMIDNPKYKGNGGHL